MFEDLVGTKPKKGFSTLQVRVNRSNINRIGQTNESFYLLSGKAWITPILIAAASTGPGVREKQR